MPAASRRPELRLTVQYPGGSAQAPTRPQIRRWLRAACDRTAEVTVRFVGRAEGQRLNRDYRGKDYATNVLSFPYESGPEAVSGDLVLCLPVVQDEAEQQGKALEAHFAHLVVHGMLHLQGHEHETGSADAERMEAREVEILDTLAYPDPYS